MPQVCVSQVHNTMGVNAIQLNQNLQPHIPHAISLVHFIIWHFTCKHNYLPQNTPEPQWFLLKIPQNHNYSSQNIPEPQCFLPKYPRTTIISPKTPQNQLFSLQHPRTTIFLPAASHNPNLVWCFLTDNHFEVFSLLHSHLWKLY